jgi:hypothetical protein
MNGSEFWMFDFLCWIDSGAPLLKHTQESVYLSLTCASPICASHTIATIVWTRGDMRVVLPEEFEYDIYI